MALTPDDVVTKQFQHVRFKEGFDPDEVDDFLDEIVVEWRKVIAERDELAAKVAAYESGSAQAAAPAPAAPAPAPVAEASPSNAAAPVATAGIIELAQRLHDEHVAEGLAQRDKLVADAKAQAASIVSEAETRGREEVARLDRERSSLESRISELRQFEHDYRAQLRSYMEGKLRDLETVSTNSASSPVSAIGL